MTSSRASPASPSCSPSSRSVEPLCASHRRAHQCIPWVHVIGACHRCMPSVHVCHWSGLRGSDHRIEISGRPCGVSLARTMKPPRCQGRTTSGPIGGPEAGGALARHLLSAGPLFAGPLGPLGLGLLSLDPLWLGPLFAGPLWPVACAALGRFCEPPRRLPPPTLSRGASTTAAGGDRGAPRRRPPAAKGRITIWGSTGWAVAADRRRTCGQFLAVAVPF